MDILSFILGLIKGMSQNNDAIEEINDILDRINGE